MSGGERRRSTDTRGVCDKGWVWQMLRICQFVFMKPPLLGVIAQLRKDPPPPLPVCVCFPQSVIVSLIRLAAESNAAKNKARNSLIHRERKDKEKKKRRTDLGRREEVIKSSLTNPVELASIKPRPLLLLLLPASPPPLFFAVPSLSSNRFMHFHSQLFGQCCLQPCIGLIRFSIFFSFALLLFPWLPDGPFDIQNCKRIFN